MIASGVDEATAYAMAAQFEEQRQTEAEARYQDLLSRIVSPADKAAEKRREWDRKRKAEKEAAKKSGGNPVESTRTPVEQVEIHPTKDAPAPVHTRGENNLSRLVDTCSAAVVVAEAREPGSDWPQGKAAEHAKLLVELTASRWLDPSKQQLLVTTTGRLDAWKRDGASWEHDVVPVVTTIARARGSPIKSWKFFDDAIGQSIADNRRALEIPTAANGPRHERPDQPSAKLAAKLDNMASAQRGFALASARRAL
jgi:hypothetical protein